MRLLIRDYIQRISLSDIIDFGYKNDVILSDDEAVILLSYLKNNWEEIIYGDPAPIINEIKKEFDNNKWNKIVKLFYFYKNKYKYYL